MTGEASISEARYLEAMELARRGQAAEARAVLALVTQSDSQPPGLRQLAEGVLAQAEGDPVVALRLAEVAVGRLPEGVYLAEAFRVLATARLLVGDHQGAEAALEQAAARFTALDRPLDVASCRANLALVLKARGRYGAALGLLDAVRPLLENQGDASELARLDLNRASLLSEVGRYEAAREAARVAIERFGETGDELEAARARWADAAAAEGLRLYQEALAGYAAAMAGLEEAGRLDEVAAIRVNMAEIYRRLGDPVLALQMLDLAAAPLEESHPAYRATLLLNRANVLAGLQRWAPAMAALDQAYEIFGRLDLRLDAAETDLLRGRLLWAQGEPARADETYLRARLVLASYGSPLEVATADLHRGELALATGRVAEAEELFLSVLGLVPEALSDLRWRAGSGLMRVAESRGDPRQALEHGLRAIDALEQLGAGLRHDLLRRGFDDAPDHGALFAAVLALCARLAEPETALEVIQRGKARGLVEAIGGASLTEVGSGPDWQEQERALAEEVNELLAAADGARGDPASYDRWCTELTSARQALLALHLALAETAPEAASLRGVGATAVDRTALAELLPEGGVLVETFVGGSDLFLLGLDCNNLRMAVVPDCMPAVDEALDRFEANLTLLCNLPPSCLAQVVPGLHVGAEADLQELFDLLLAPLADLIDGADYLVIAPHGRLWAVPFAALHDGLDMLVDRVAVALVPSAAALPALARHAAEESVGGLAVAGDTAHLAAVEGELRAVCGALEMQLMPAEEVSRERLLAALPDRRLIHYCGHADFRPESPLFSALRLANGERLTAADLYRRRIAAELVTLAACETGRHDGASSAELVGLARAFLHAGARTVVATLWSAPDVATGYLMATFYRLLQEQHEPARALREAQRQVRAETLHPFFWAGFAAIGMPWRPGAAT